MRKLLVLLYFISAAVSAAPTAITQQNCSWDKPGEDRYTGSVSDAVDYYIDIPKASREILKRRIAAHDYDDQVNITKDAIEGERTYTPDIREMHFGANRVCSQVTRTRWPVKAVQPALMYCEKLDCIIVPFVCGNLSRVNILAWPKVLTPVPVLWTPPEFPPMPYLPLIPSTTPPPTVMDAQPPVYFDVPIPGFPSTPGYPRTVRTPTKPYVPPTPVPEPGSICLMLLGLGVILAMHRKK